MATLSIPGTTQTAGPAINASTVNYPSTPAVSVNSGAGLKSNNSMTTPLIATSSASRTNYSNNVSTMNGVNNALATSNNNKSNGVVTPVAPGSASEKAGIVGYGAGGNAIYGTPSTSTPTAPAAPAAPATNSNTGATTTSGSGGSTATTDTSNKALDPTIKQMYENNNSGLDSQLSSANAVLASATATLANDPAALGVIQSIQRQYDQLITIQKQKNDVIMGGLKVSAARNGGLQYANEMNSQFLGDQQQKANDRISTLVDKENDAIAKANLAFKKQNFAEYDAAVKNVQKIQDEKSKNISDLAKATNEALKTAQAEQRAQQIETNQQLSNDIRISNSIATADLVDALNAAPANTKQELINQIATANGINNTAILSSALEKASAAADKAALAAKNTASIIDKRNNPSPKSGSSTYSGFTKPPTAANISKVNKYIIANGGNQAAIDKINSDEVLFYTALNKTSSTNQPQ